MLKMKKTRKFIKQILISTFASIYIQGYRDNHLKTRTLMSMISPAKARERIMGALFSTDNPSILFLKIN